MGQAIHPARLCTPQRRPLQRHPLTSTALNRRRIRQSRIIIISGRDITVGKVRRRELAVFRVVVVGSIRQENSDSRSVRYGCAPVGKDAGCLDTVLRGLDWIREGHGAGRRGREVVRYQRSGEFTSECLGCGIGDGVGCLCGLLPGEAGIGFGANAEEFAGDFDILAYAIFGGGVLGEAVECQLFRLMKLA